MPIPDWPSTYWHEGLRLLLVIYVDDFKLAGAEVALPNGWKLLVVYDNMRA